MLFAGIFRSRLECRKGRESSFLEIVQVLGRTSLGIF